MKPVRIALCQCESDIGTAEVDPREANLVRLRDWARRAGQQGAQIAVFGELYFTGYRTDNAMYRYVLAPGNDDTWVRKLTDVAQEMNIWLLLGTASSDLGVPGDMYNSAFLVSPGGLAGVYHKTHLGNFVIDDELVANEGAFYGAGGEIDVHDTPFARLGVQICYDAHFPEVSRVLALKGAEIIITVSAAVQGFERFWEVLLPARAEENRIWYAMSSVVGAQKDTVFFGGSRIMDPVGRCVARGADNGEDLVIADLHPDELSHGRLSSHRFSARRPELYGVIAELTRLP